MKRKGMLKKSIYFLVAVVTFSMYSALPTLAHVSPAGCNSNRLNLSITRDKLTIKQGEQLTYTVTLSNLDFESNIACDIDGATVRVTLPALDGTPTGDVVILTNTGNYPAGTTVSVVGVVPYTVNVNPGVVDVVAEARVTGTLHDAPVDHSAEISKTIGTIVVADETPPNDEDSLTLPGLPNTAASAR